MYSLRGCWCMQCAETTVIEWGITSNLRVNVKCMVKNVIHAIKDTVLYTSARISIKLEYLTSYNRDAGTSLIHSSSTIIQIFNSAVGSTSPPLNFATVARLSGSAIFFRSAGAIPRATSYRRNLSRPSCHESCPLFPTPWISFQSTAVVTHNSLVPRLLPRICIGEVRYLHEHRFWLSHQD